MSCMTFELLSRVPIPGWRLRLCQWHVDRCCRCHQESDRSDALPPLLVAADRLTPAPDLWPGSKKGIAATPAREAGPEVVSLPAGGAWRWAYAALVMLLLGAGFWTLLKDGPSGPLPITVNDRPAERTRLCSAKIGSQPARVFQVQSRNPDRSIFWIAKDDNRS